MKNIVLSCTILLLLLVSNLQADSIKIAYVDMTQVFDQILETKTVTEALSKEVEDKREEISKRQKEIEKTEKELKEAIMLNEKEKNKREIVINQKKEELQKFADEARNSLLKKEQEQTQKIVKAISKVIENIAIKEDINLVLDKSVVLYGIDEIDLTQKIIEILNKKK
ncbi:OmpH family outer membrane protein [bacterium]|nr:OmpH family outer membrane protein [bacterium]